MWEVKIRKKTLKNLLKLPMNIKVAFSFLKNDLESNGPMAVWEIKDKTIKLMEVTYVGTHEKATY